MCFQSVGPQQIFKKQVTHERLEAHSHLIQIRTHHEVRAVSFALRSNLLLSLLLVPDPATSAQVQPKSEVGVASVIRVRLFNYAGVGDQVLAAAKRHTNRTLGKVGLETVWVDCPTSVSELQINTSCRGRLTTTELAIRIMQRSTNPRYPLGFAALPTAKDGVASQASVFFKAAEELAAGYPASTAQTLGHIMAHEIGHLLLGVGSHSRTGIMRTSWRKQEMELAARGALGFTRKQQARIRRELLRRLEMASP